MRGDIRSVKLILKILEKFGQLQDDNRADAPLSDDDQAILARFLKRDMSDDSSGSSAP